MSEIVERKLSHLDLCVRSDVESHGSTLFDQVRLLHEALPELSCDEIDPSLEMMGRWLQAPILISGMTGGAPRARELNRALATGAQKSGLGHGCGIPARDAAASGTGPHLSGAGRGAGHPAAGQHRRGAGERVGTGPGRRAGAGDRRGRDCVCT